MRGLGGALINERQDMVGCNSHEGGWMDRSIEDSIAIDDAYIASIAMMLILIKTETKIKGVLQDTQDPRNNCKIYNTGDILNSIIPV